MLKPRRMLRVRIQCLTGSLPELAWQLARLDSFAPDPRPIEEPGDTALLEQDPTCDYGRIHAQTSERLQKIGRHIAVAWQSPVTPAGWVSLSQLSRANEQLGELWRLCSEYEERVRGLNDELRRNQQLEATLANFASLDIDLSLLQNERSFLDIRLGVVPRHNLEQLRAALEIAGYHLFPFLEQGESRHLVVLGPKGDHPETVETLLDTAGFHPLMIPQELQAEPRQASTTLQQQRQLLLARLRQEESDMQDCANLHRAELQQLAGQVHSAAPCARLQGAARARGELSVLQGWVPEAQFDDLQSTLKAALQDRLVIDAWRPTAEDRGSIPSLMARSRLLHPFAILVRQYGVPRYGEIDPTLLFSFSFIAMFGMMFGDLGQGAVIVLVALALRRRLGPYTQFAVLAGLSAMLFGWLYGSVFGYEEWISPRWLSPMHHPMTLLTLAVAWGAGFLLLGGVIAIHNRLVENNLEAALFESNGLLSLLLYLSLLGGGLHYGQAGSFGLLPMILLTLTLLGIFSHRLVEARGGLGERILVALIETFETLTGYLSNTFSFLRVAAFSLNHVALAIAIFTLAEMSSGAGHWLTLVLGNLFILVLEGAIVTIQVLRLEYFEGFSRFYAGDGTPFHPLTLSEGRTP